MPLFEKASTIAILGAVFGSLTLAAPAAGETSVAGTQQGTQQKGHGEWLANVPRDGERDGYGHWLADATTGAAEGYGHWLARATPGLGLAYDQAVTGLRELAAASGEPLTANLPRDGRDDRNGHGHWLADSGTVQEGHGEWLATLPRDGGDDRKGHGHWLADSGTVQEGHGEWLATLPRDGSDDREGHGHWLAGLTPEGSAQGYGHWLAQSTPALGLAYNQVIVSLGVVIEDPTLEGYGEELGNIVPRDGHDDRKGPGYWLA